MDCTTAKKYFSPMLDARLTESARLRIEGHLESCSECDGDYASYQQLFGALRSLPSERMERSLPLPESSTPTLPRTLALLDDEALGGRCQRDRAARYRRSHRLRLRRRRSR